MVNKNWDLKGDFQIFSLYIGDKKESFIYKALFLNPFYIYIKIKIVNNKFPF